MDFKKLAEIIRHEVRKGTDPLFERTFQRGIVESYDLINRTCDVFIEGNEIAHPNIPFVADVLPEVGDKVLILSIGRSGANLVIVSIVEQANPTWTAMSLASGWSEYGGNYSPSGFYKTPDGIVHLRGLIKRSTTTHATITTMPTGYRPTSELILTTSSGQSYGQIRIRADGNLRSVVGAINDWISLDGVSFRAEQ